MASTKSKHAFGSEANIDSALAQGLIDAYDILFLDERKIGWIDKDGNKIIPDYFSGEIDESFIDSKIETAKLELESILKDYADEQIAAGSNPVVEF